MSTEFVEVGGARGGLVSIRGVVCIHCLATDPLCLFSEPRTALSSCLNLVSASPPTVKTLRVAKTSPNLFRSCVIVKLVFQCDCKACRTTMS